VIFGEIWRTNTVKWEKKFKHRDVFTFTLPSRSRRFRLGIYNI